MTTSRTLRTAALLSLLWCTTPASAADPLPTRYEMVGVSQQDWAITWLSSKRGPYRAPPPSAGLRWVVRQKKGSPLTAEPGRAYPELGFQALEPGHFEVQLEQQLLQIDALSLRALDARDAVLDPLKSHASLSRVLPPELGAIPGADDDALRFMLIAPVGVEVPGLQVLSVGATGNGLDYLERFEVAPAVCPDGVAPELVCRQTAALRAVGDGLDRKQQAASKRSVHAVIGGALRFSISGRPLLELKIGGPRLTRVGPIERLRAKLRVLVLRQHRGGPPALGGSDAAARQVMTRELSEAAGLWGQCGIELGAPGQPLIEIVDPPRSQLITVGCGAGQPASGGELRFRAGKRSIRLTTRPGESPSSVALRLADALGAAGQKGVKVFENQRAAGDALPSADVLLQEAARLEPEPQQALSSDATLPLCSSGVDLSDGLTHFGDIDAFVGTVEERALLRSFDDGDASTIEVLVVPSFARSERIGESFIQSPGASLSSAVIIDRQAILAGARSFALAHELGHVFLAMPGHPDDFGVDQSWSLMDADVADPTIFGPRRLSVADCERAVTESGPTGLVPLLTPIPLH